MIHLSFTKGEMIVLICADSGCLTSLINKMFLKVMTPDTEVVRLKTLISVKEVRPSPVFCEEYVKINFYISGLIDGKQAIEHFQ